MSFEWLSVLGSRLGTPLQTILMCDAIQPGHMASYDMCKLLYLFHPHGAKMAEKPVAIAQSQPREIVCPDGPEDLVVEAFLTEWDKLRADHVIFATYVQARVYGIASLALMVDGEDTDKPVDFKNLWKEKVSFNVYDPLNTAGSLVLNQDPLAMDFQHAQEIRVNNAMFHKSRTRVVMNEFPIYISYTPSTYGFSGRSIYQRSLFAMKSFVQTQVTNDMVSVKAGVLIAKIKQYGATITNTMLGALGFKRNVVKEAVVGNVISIGGDGDDITSINMQNLEGPFKMARTNIIEDEASGAGMPAKMLTEESFSAAFSEGSEDAREQSRYIMKLRREMRPLYVFMDEICMRRAWNPDFIDLIKQTHKNYGKMDTEAIFYQWKDSFRAEWPSLLTEPDSELVKVDDVKLKAMIAIVEVLMPRLDGENFTKVIEWLADNMNEMKLLFGSPLVLNYETLQQGFEDSKDAQTEEDVKPSKPFSAADSAETAIASFSEAVEKLKAKAKKENPT
jgi:hypothetical protein